METHHHSRHNVSSYHCCSYDGNLDDVHPFGLMCYVHYDDLVADNYYYPDLVDVVTTNPNTDGSVGSLQPLPA